MNQQSNSDINKDFILESFLDIPDLSISDLGFYHTPYSVGLIGLTNFNDINSYVSKFKYLSPAVEKIVFEFSTAEFIDSRLGNSFGLSKEQKIETAKIVRDILLGDSFIGDFVKTVQTKLNVDEKKANDIVSMIVAELLPPAIESIKRVQRIKFPNKIQELAKTKPTAPAQPGSVQSVKPSAPMPVAKPPMPAQPSAKPPLPPRPTQSPSQSFLQGNAPKPTSQPMPSIKKEIPQAQTPASTPSQPQSMRPLGQMRPSNQAPYTSFQQPTATRPVTPPTMPKPAVPPLPPKPAPAKPEFKIPDLGSSRAIPDKLPIQDKPTPPKQEPIVFKEEKNKSIDEELDKIANVIDLRAKSES